MFEIMKIVNMEAAEVHVYYCLRKIDSDKFLALKKNFYYAEQHGKLSNNEYGDSSFLEQLFYGEELLEGQWFDTIGEAIKDFDEGFK